MGGSLMWMLKGGGWGGPLPHSRLTHGQCAWQSRFVPKAKPEAGVMKGPNIQ
jgi:hypothetical protein